MANERKGCKRSSKQRAAKGDGRQAERKAGEK
jgi:hypothetical protein